jgi:phosphoribosyl 1,2-cyclic phosphodiesterase
MKLTFLGTRGEIEARTRQHRMHSSLLIADGGSNIMVDCGLDWLERVVKIRLTAIFLTHAHSDHAGGLKNGAPCEVFATRETWKKLQNFAIGDRSVVVPYRAITICGLSFEAFPVQHSLVAPAVGYRISSSGRSILYVPDVVSIRKPARALSGISLCRSVGSSLDYVVLLTTGMPSFIA